MVNTKSIPLTPWLTEMVDSITKRKMATMSSITSVPMARPVKRSSFKPISSIALMVIMVEDMDSIPPKKILSMVLQPIASPSIIPSISMPIICTSADMMPVAPTVTSLCRLNSSPRLNIRKITPISAHNVILAESPIVGIKLTTGPMRNPARI